MALSNDDVWPFWPGKKISPSPIDNIPHSDATEGWKKNIFLNPRQFSQKCNFTSHSFQLVREFGGPM